MISDEARPLTHASDISPSGSELVLTARPRDAGATIVRASCLVVARPGVRLRAQRALGATFAAGVVHEARVPRALAAPRPVRAVAVGVDAAATRHVDHRVALRHRQLEQRGVLRESMAFGLGVPHVPAVR